MAWRLELQGISKRYPGVVANDAVDLRVAPGAIHAVLGENGAGKSTLMKIIYGAEQADSGRVLVDGTEVRVHNPQAARALGIAMVFQHFSLFESVSVAENVWLGQPAGVTLAQVAARIEQVAAAYGLDVDPARPLHALSVGERQRVEIIRALLTGPRLLILDEPTSVLAPHAVQRLFDTLRQLAAGGCSIVYISHKLDEVRALCHSCTVLRGGRVVAEVDPAQHDNAGLSRLMIGTDLEPPPHRPASVGAVLLELDGVGQPPADAHGVALRDLALQLRAGEIVGLAGVSGNGQRELLALLSGEDARPLRAGSMRLLGQQPRGVAARRAAGLRVVPEERLGRGAVPTMDLAANALLTHAGRVGHGWLHWQAWRRLAAEVIARFDVRAAGPQASAGSLSGGNLQKFIVGRELAGQPRVLVLAQPTWGVDVGAAARIHAELRALRDSGGAVLVISEELDELFEICDRIAVLARGRLSPALPIGQADSARIGAWMSGLWDAAPTHAEAADAAA